MQLSKSLAIAIVFFALAPATFGGDQPTDDKDAAESSSLAADAKTDKSSRPFKTVSVRGKVVWLAAALEEQFGISSVPEAAERSLALLTPKGEIFPLVENLRGRAFRKDKRLRGKDMELVVRRYEQQPMVQVLKIYEFDEGNRYEVDYWCDVCAIVMFETGPCSCCQDHNRLRKRPAAVASDQ